MEKRIVIKDGTSKAQLTKAIKNFEACTDTTVLKIFICENHMYNLIEFDGISVAKWGGFIDDFMNEVEFTKMTLIDLF